MPRAIAFDLKSFFAISHCEIDGEWFSEYGLPAGLTSIKRLLHDDVLYFVDKLLESDDCPIVVIDLTGDYPVFRGDEIDRYALDRIATVVRSFYTNSVSIPYSWHPHNEGSLQSIYAAPKSVGGGARVHFDSDPAGNRDLLFFARTDKVIRFSSLPRPDDIYLASRAGVAAVIASKVANNLPGVPTTGIFLSQRLPQGFVHGATLKEWYTTKLTDEQRSFVDKPYHGPVRLRGAAGTGKTVSLVIKFLIDGCKFEQGGEDKRFCFLTHSASTVDLVSGICDVLDPMGLILGQGKHVALQVRTLYDLAFEYLRFDLDHLSPLSLDGREGRQLQAELIRGVLREMLSDFAKARYSDISKHLHNAWQGTDKSLHERFVQELMNEFASVLDADSVWAGTDKGEKYAKGQFGYRPTWLMDLPTERDRRFVLEVHRRYRAMLSQMDSLSVDQMVADFNSFLDHNTWSVVKKTKGFDAVFVDELHLFTSIERQVLHKLIRGAQGADGALGRPPIFMAYDIKQSPRDTFTEASETSAALFSASTQLQNSDLVQLSKVFRYTPQIAEFLYDLDATFPAIDLAGEWEKFAAIAEVDEGERPTLTVYKDQAALLASVFDAAMKQARKLGGRRVAVLCLNESIFDQYTEITKKRFEKKLIYISSREPHIDLRHGGKKAIFSMPEYVAGLQFEVVFLIHVDAEDAPKSMTVGENRRLISSLYLGASRAERELLLSCCEARGGPAPVLELALARKTLLGVDAA